MTLLLHPHRIGERRDAARGALAPLASSLADDLQPVLARDVFIPAEKARLSRDGGRCPDDAALLGFDPFSPRLHRCPQCGKTYGEEAHYRWWIMSYQLWLAERTVHGAVLALLRGDRRAAAFSERILEQYVARYLGYPNSDNVLGPSRLFFSTYLESIWLLQIAIATDLLEAGGHAKALGGTVRDRIIEPGSAIVREYDEGGSNRQVWNNAALLASAALLGSTPELEPLVWGPSGLASHLARGLLSDGTWFEGENYHLFAHRGLWYGVQLAERLDLGLAEAFVAPYMKRFGEGFAASFATALPDLTLPSRRDSQYAISIRQWRFAELCELGLARHEDPRLAAMLARLYNDDVPRRQTGRDISTAEVERNLPATKLARSDLGWRSLLLASPVLRVARAEPPKSLLLEGQGYAILRRAEGVVYVALDYGHSGGGHGHPDRLNLQLAQGTVRWLDDMGTGSYVDPTLHWYRSTLAHNAPLVDGSSQILTHGALRAFEERPEAGWVDAEVEGIAPGVSIRRSLVAMDGYAIDIIEWRAASGIQFDLPVHLDVPPVDAHLWVRGALTGGTGVEDGFDWVTDAASVERGAGEATRVAGTRDGASIAAWLRSNTSHELWRATGPGPPGRPPAAFYVIRSRGTSGLIHTVLDWSAAIRDVRFSEETLIVARVSGADDIHERREDAWHIRRTSPSGVTTMIELGGGKMSPAPTAADHPPPPVRRRPRMLVPVVATEADAPSVAGLQLSMAEKHYRRSELPWKEAGAPSARVRLIATATTLLVRVEVSKASPVHFASPSPRNPLDNENPDINSDGVQIHLATAEADSPASRWLLVPEGQGGIRMTASPEAPPMDAAWERTATGYAVRCAITLTPVMREGGFDLDVIVNEMSPDRERRRGQLVLGGALGEWIYLQGDRHARDRFVPFALETRAP